MRSWFISLLLGLAVIGTATLIGAATSMATAGADDLHTQSVVFERLSGYQEDPLAFSTPGSATFVATINDRDQSISYRLSYKDLPTNVVQAHIHLGGKAQSGGVSVFLCGGGPVTAPAPACPPGNATVTGTLTAANVIGPAAQGIAAGEFAELVQAIRAGTTYVNVHTTERPGGEIRAQIERH